MRYRFTIILLILLRFTNAQTPYFPYFYDANEIDLTVDSLRQNKVNEILVVRTERIKICNQCRDSILTIIIWPADSGLNNLKVITSNAIYKPFKAHLDKRVLNYQNKIKVFRAKEEDVFKFVPPLTNNNAIFYFSKKLEGYYEQGDNLNKSPTTYIPTDPNREKYRKEWFELILNNLKTVHYSLILKRIYNRHKELEVEK